MGRILTFLCGGVVGAVAGLVLSPGSGSQNIDRFNEMIANQYPDQHKAVTEKAGQAVDAVATNSTKLINTVVDNAGDLKGSVAARAQEGTSAASEAFTSQTEELRAKIDSARERIAEQVKKNAEESTDKPEEAEAEVVEEKAE